MSLFTSLEPEERRELLREAGQTYGLNTFIETGTNQGLTPLALINSFDRLHTIELDNELFQRAHRMFESYGGRVQCWPGNSTDVLPRILAVIDEPALVWLDGHYSGPGTAFTPESTPIREELRILFNDGRPHVIYVDDARIFDGGPEHTLYPHYEPYPSIRWVEDYAVGNKYNFVLEDDIMKLTPA